MILWMQSADILTSLAGTTAGTVRERRRPYKLGGLSAQVTWGLHEQEATSPERELFSQTWNLYKFVKFKCNNIYIICLYENISSWRFCRAQIVSRRRVWAPIFWWMHSFGAYILIGFQRPPCFCRISCGAVILQFRTALPPTFAAYILRVRLHFEQAPIFWAGAYISCMC